MMCGRSTDTPLRYNIVESRDHAELSIGKDRTIRRRTQGYIRLREVTIAYGLSTD